MSASPSLTWLSQMTQLLNAEGIKVPNTYKDKVIAVKGLLEQDSTGIVSSILDFAINSATIDYYVESDHPPVEKLLNDWFLNINSVLRGKIPTGIKALAKEYFRERWKGSGMIVLRTVWETVDGMTVPTKLWFVDGENIVVEGGQDGIRRLGEETYKIVVGEKEIKLPGKKDEKIFVQKPFTTWGTLEPVPFLIQRGLYKNLKIYDTLINKGEQVVTKALEYLMMVKKGTEKMAMSENPDFIYSKEDLNSVKEDLKEFLGNRGAASGSSVYTTNFDTDITHLIPEYKNILHSELSNPIERRLLAGLGMIDIVQGTTSSRKEALLNPKPFIQEVKSGIEDFKALFTDVLKEMVEVNKGKHKKYFSKDVFIQVHNVPVSSFFDSDTRQLLRSMYDRGVLSKRTFAEVIGEVDFDIEVERRTQESKDGLEELMYPPIIVNNEKDPDVFSPNSVNTMKPPATNITPKKTGPEAKNFKSASQIDGHEKQEDFGYEEDDPEMLKALEDLKYEEAPYKTNKELPKSVKEYPAHAQDIFRNAFNNALKTYKDEVLAFKVAWAALKKSMGNP